MSEQEQELISGHIAEVAELRAQVRQLRRYGFYSNVAKLGGELCRMARGAVPWVFSFLMVRELAGKSTMALVFAHIDTGPEAHSDWNHRLMILLVVIAVSGLIYGKRQAALRKDQLERLHPFQRKYEELLDSNRSSSNITRRGETPSEDL